MPSKDFRMNPDKMNEIMTVTSQVGEAASQLAKACRDFVALDASHLRYEQFEQAGESIEQATNHLAVAFSSLQILQQKIEAENEARLHE